MTRFLLIISIYYASLCHQLDPQLVTAVVFVESSFRPQVVNHGCYGLMQVNYSVWKSLLVANRPLDKKRLLEPLYNLDAGTTILRHYYEMTNDVDKALQFYNCGPSGKYKSNYVNKVREAYKLLYGREM